jgi:hypothetical protein
MAVLTSYEGSNNDYENGGTGGYRAQSFQIQNNANISGVSIYGSKGNGATGTFKIILVSTLGGAELATTGTLNTSTLTTYGLPDWNAVTFSTPYSATKDTTYYLVVRPLSGSVSDEVRLSLDNTSPSYSYGSKWDSTDNVTWAETSGSDYNFRVSGTVSDISLSCGTGAFTLTGIATTFNRGWSLVCSTGNYVLTGIATTLKRTGTQWTNQTKNSSTFTNTTKSSTSWTNQSKS